MMNETQSKRLRCEEVSVPYNKLSSGLHRPHSSLSPRTASYHKIWRKKKSKRRPTFSSPPVTRGLRSGIVVVIRSRSIGKLGRVWDSYKPTNNCDSIYWLDIFLCLTDFCRFSRPPLEKGFGRSLGMLWQRQIPKWTTFHQDCKCRDDSV